MKGPSLPYELRVLRVFRCGACGRIVHLPGHATSHLCHCTSPPKFMQPQERPVTKSPDVTEFLSPADPSELVEEVETEEEPYVPYIPKLPPRPPQFPSRRKLSDEIDKFVPPEFGDGLESTGEQAKDESEQTAPHDVASRRGPSQQGGDRKERPDRRGPRGRDQGDRRPDRRPESPARTEHPSRSDSNRPQRHTQDTPRQQPPEQHASPKPSDIAAIDASGSVADGTESADRSERGRRGRRRRGRDRGTLDSDSRDTRSSDANSPESTGSTDADPQAHQTFRESRSDDDFGLGVESSAGSPTGNSSANAARGDAGNRNRNKQATQSTPAHRSQQRPPERQAPAVLGNSNMGDPLTDGDAEADDDGPDDVDVEQTSADASEPRRRRNRRRGRRRGRGGNGGEGSSNTGQPSVDGSIPNGPGPGGAASSS